MKKLLALAAFLLASTTAQAQYTFQYGGYTIHVDPDRGKVSIPGIYDNTGHKSKRAKTDQESSRRIQDPPQASVDPQLADPAAAPAPAAGSQTPTPAAGASPPPAAAPTTTANNAPAEAIALPAPLPPLPAPAPVQQEATPAVTHPPASPSPAVAAAPPAAPPAPVQAPVQPPAPTPTTAAARDPNSPLGVWLTEEKEGKVRIEQCGTNLCGYSVDSKSNQNGEQVLINMKPGKDLKWTGRILDPNTGSSYDSTIALKGPDTLRVQGCAFGGMFCGGQTWTRVN